MPEPAVTVRECVSVEDFQQCIELERSVSNDDDVGIMPIRLYLLSKSCKAPTIGSKQAVGDPDDAFCIDLNHIAPLEFYFNDVKNDTPEVIEPLRSARQPQQPSLF